MDFGKAMNKPFEDEFDDTDFLPTRPRRPELQLPSTYAFEDFLPVQESSDDRTTTESDVALLNNGLAVLNHAWLQAETIDEAAKVAGAIVKLVITRRQVKKLEVGAPSGRSNGGRVFEVLE